MFLKVLAELSMIILVIILLTVTNKFQQMMDYAILNIDDVNYVNSLGWAASWILCVFNVLFFIITLLDYLFTLLDHLKKKKQ
jgi:type III secretory pathway component EscU